MGCCRPRACGHKRQSRSHARAARECLPHKKLSQFTKTQWLFIYCFNFVLFPFSLTVRSIGHLKWRLGLGKSGWEQTRTDRKFDPRFLVQFDTCWEPNIILGILGKVNIKRKIFAPLSRVTWRHCSSKRSFSSFTYRLNAIWWYTVFCLIGCLDRFLFNWLSWPFKLPLCPFKNPFCPNNGLNGRWQAVYHFVF